MAIKYRIVESDEIQNREDDPQKYGNCSVRFFRKANPVLPAWIVDSCISERSWQNPIPFLNIDTQGDTVSIFERLDLN